MLGGLITNVTPPFVGRLIGWWDTSVTASMTIAGGFCSSIADQSGNGNTMNSVTTTTAYSATGFNTTFPALIFDVSFRAGYFTRPSFAIGAGSELTCWYVGNLIDNGSPFLDFGRAMSYAKPASNDYDNVGSWALTRNGVGNANIRFSRNSLGSDALVTLTSPHRVILTVNSSGVPTTYVNGVATIGTTVAGNWVSGGTMFLGSNGNPGVQGYWNGPISEWGISTGFTDATAVAALDLSLKTKWGL